MCGVVEALAKPKVPEAKIGHSQHVSVEGERCVAQLLGG